MKGYVSLAYMIAFAIVIVTISFVVFVFFTSFEAKMEGYEMSSTKLGEIYVLNKIITSRNCISTGKTGILNKTLLDDANGGGELECAYLPDFAHHVKVDDLSDGVGWNWEFGYNRKSLSGIYESFEFPVLISDDDTNEVKLGKIRIRIISSKDDTLLYLAGMAERAWLKTNIGETFKRKFNVPETDTSWNLEFKSNEICDTDEGICKKLYNATLDTPATYRIHVNDHLTINYEKISGPKLNPTLDGTS